jgi:glyoxylase-like metal-dependent hydrolase (beta-lactamase superfamily II)
MAALRRYPDLLLQRAQERAETLRWLAEENIEGKRYHVIAFAESDGTLVTLFFDAETGLLAKCETFADHPIFGDTVTELLFFDYRLVAGVTWPFRLVVRNAGEIVQDLSYAEVQIDTPLNEDFFTPPSGVAYGPPMGDPTSVDITPLAEGVYFIGGSTYNSLAVAFDKFLLVIEAPVGEERSEAVLSELKKLAPEKPVRYIVPTHYHIDHLGGIRRYIAEGAIVVTTPGNERFIRAVAATPHTVKPDALARAPREPHVEVFHGKRVFSDGSRTLELYDIGPNPHADEILIAYLPRERILFQSDLFNIPPVGEPVASDATRHFARKIAELGLDVALIVPGHVRLGTMDDLRKALERK